ncbi:hypothetical protein ACLB6G_08070 [Zhengella sp. ZM62]|uniref:hypothetical protein n=1 Tax=Zhengella sedimenti TaxID=3390035 RepID=UPI003975FAA2
MPLIEGNDSANVLSDTAGNDTIFAYGGNDTVTVTNGVDFADGGNGVDTLVINWSGAWQATYVYSYGGTYAYVNTNTNFTDSTRSVDYQYFEHLNVTTGSGNDVLEGIHNAWDILNGGAGADEWRDSFSSLTTGLSIDMALVSSSGGQSYGDGTTVRNLEIASLTLTQGNDVFRDDGAYDDTIFGYSGDDDIGTSGGVDFVDGGNGEDTLTIDWSDATQSAYVYAYNASYGYVNTNTNFTDSTRSVDFQYIEHLDVTTGSGSDIIEGVHNAWDMIDGGAGVDLWRDSFSSLTTAVTVFMSSTATGAGQTLVDGSHISNIERAELTLSQGNDIFRDYGPRDDIIFGYNGNDNLGTTNGRDFIDGGNGTDTLVINWSDATQQIYVDAYSGSSAYVNTNTNFTDSTRRVDFQYIEHLVVTAGSADDDIEGVYNAWDILDGGAGTDIWRDSFHSRTAGLTINMSSVSSAGGQSYADGTTVRNLEVARLTLTQGNDVFTDHGAHDDVIFAIDGSDNIGTSNGRDFVDGGNGEDTLTIDWSDATQSAYVYAYNASYGYVNTNTNFTDSTRRVDFQYVEHLDVTTGSGNDLIEGVYNAFDRIDGGAGVDLWRDSFSSLTSGISVYMANASSSAGQYLADGSQVRNIERAQLTLSQGNDIFRDHGAHDDTIYGGDGNDNLGSSNGVDFIDGGNGTDTLVIDWSDATDEIFVYSSYAYVNTNTNFTDSTRSVDFQYVENVVVYLGSGADTVNGSSGNDVLNGGGGNDTITGYAGNDTINGGAGADTLDGGTGFDTLSYEGSSAGVQVFLGGNTATGGDATGDTIAGFENVFGSAHNDRLYGSAQVNLIDGGAGSDIILGNNGNDTLRGREGRDIIYGGNHADTFVYLALSDSGLLFADRDRIQDFQNGLDRFDLSALDANTNVAGNQAFTYAGGTFTGVAGQLRSWEFGGLTFIEGDVDGNGYADFRIELLGTGLGIDASDFVL